MTQKKFLDDIGVMRLVLIVLLVLYHSFAIYKGSWVKPVDSLPDIQAYWWIAAVAYSFLLEAFVFISGYLLGYQVTRKGPEVLTFKQLVGKKAKRLLLPSILFSIVYYLMFYDLHKPVGEIIYSIINGCGHMWFLPMLFWCFVGVFVVEKIHLSKKVLWSLIVIASLCSFVPLPFRLSSAMKYFLFFYIGYVVAQNREEIVSRIKGKHALASVGLWVVSLLLFVQVDSILSDWGGQITGTELVDKAIKLIISYAFIDICALFGVAMVYISVNFFLKKSQSSLSPFWIKLSSLCFGVYIYQQFILKYLYYHTDLALNCSAAALPWIGFGIALIGSLLLSWLTQKTKFGRFLIG